MPDEFYPRVRSANSLVKRALLAAGLLAAACQSAAPPPAPGTAAPASRYQPEPAAHAGGTLVLADYEVPDTLDPLHAQTASDLRISSLLFAPLWGHDPDLVPYPDLVAAVPSLGNGLVKLGRDGNTMTVDIRLVPGLRWSDGQPVTADDVIFTVDAICSSVLPGRDTTGFDHIATQERRSDSEVVWHFGPRPRGACGLGGDLASGVLPAYELLGPRARLLPRHRLAGVPAAKWPGEPFFRRPDVVTGPFQLAGGAGDQLLSFVADPHYADGRSVAGAYGSAPVRFDHSPRLESIRYRIFTGKAAEIAGLVAGEADLGFHLQPADLGELKGVPASAAIAAPGLQGEFLNPNHATNTATKRAPPWVRGGADDRPLLAALDLAIDRDEINRAAFGGLAVPTAGLYPAAMRSWADPGRPAPRHDPAAAARMLDADGWRLRPGSGTRERDGRALAFTLTIPCENATRKVEADILAADWGAAGAAVRVECRPRAQFFGSFLAHGLNAIGAFDMTLYSNTWEPDPAAWNPFAGSIPSDLEPGGQNWNRCLDSGLDADLQAAARLVDQPQRRVAYLAVQRDWLDYRCTIPLLDLPQVVQRPARLRNLVLNTGAATDTWNAADWWIAA